MTKRVPAIDKHCETGMATGDTLLLDRFTAGRNGDVGLHLQLGLGCVVLLDGVINLNMLLE